MNYRIFPISENTLTIDFGNRISIELNEKVIGLSKIINQNKFDGLIEVVPAYSSLTLFFDLKVVKKKHPEFPTAFSFVKTYVEGSLKYLENFSHSVSQPIRIPVNYNPEYGPDLEFVAANSNLTTEEVIKLHTARIYRVFMIGFLPGFAYLGEVDEKIATVRKNIPRTKIAKGSVGIAGKQTGIYPLESPGGWQIIGKTGLEMFRPDEKEISLLKTGDYVQFYDVNSK